jgi:phage baseplate assembly protein W
MAIIVNNKFPIDNIARKAVGVDIPFNGPAVFKSNYLTREAIQNNLTNFFSTRKGERVFNPFFGSILFNTVFESITEITEETLIKIMQDECAQFFPFVNIKEININRNEDFNRLDITLTYVATNFGIEDEINIQL